MKLDGFKGLIFDVGMHDGSDTAFYLQQGYAVVAIEADPDLASAAAARFAAAINDGQLTILNVGIAERAGKATFWIADDNSVWNSFDVRIASRNGGRHHAIQIETTRFEDVLKTFGVPVYLKVDIEGYDALCVKDVGPGRLPRFISVESECAGDGDELSPKQAVQMLDLLRDAGYRRFKLISQDGFRTAGSTDLWKAVRRVLESAAYGKLRAPGFSSVARRLCHQDRLQRRNQFQFACGSTGPWGPGLLGRWRDYQAARTMYLRLREQYFRQNGVKTYSFWYDWHATY